jgi:hypothetical protein
MNSKYRHANNIDVLLWLCGFSRPSKVEAVGGLPGVHVHDAVSCKGAITVSAGNWINLLGALCAGLAVLLPVIGKRIERRDQLSRLSYLVALLRTEKELGELLGTDGGALLRATVGREAAALLGKIERNDKKQEAAASHTLFIGLAVAEAFLFLGLLFATFSTFIIGLIKGKSYESGVYFFEGIFGYPAARIGLLVLSVGAAAGLTLKLAPGVGKYIRGYLGQNFSLLAIFNLIFCGTIVVVATLLALLDPIVPLW